MASPTVTYSFTNSTTADAGQINTNFSDLIASMTDGTKDFSISALTVAGAFTANGNVTLGNATSDTITTTGRLASSLVPGTTNSYDLGSSILGYAGIYFGANSQTVRIVGSSSMSATYTFTLPVSGGTADYLLQTNGSGTTSWAALNTVPKLAVIDATDGNITLTVSSARHQVFTGFSVTRDVTLPTTSVAAGDTFLLENTTVYDMVVKASGGNALTLANSCNQDATIKGGFVKVRAIQATPTTPAHWRVVDVYERYTGTATMSGALSAAGTRDCNFALTRDNAVVTFQVTANTASQNATSTDRINIPTSMPTRFTPFGNGGTSRGLLTVIQNTTQTVGHCEVVSTQLQVNSSTTFGTDFTSGQAARVLASALTWTCL